MKAGKGGKLYCPYCGKKDIEIPGKCPHCGKNIREVDKESRYECEKCGHDVSADALYCWFCGNNVEEIVADESEARLVYCPYCGKKDIEIPGKCPHCGKDVKEVDKESRYECEKCGHDVSADALYCWFCGNNVEEIVTDESEARLVYCPYCGKKDIEIPGKCPHCCKNIKEVDKESRYQCEKCGHDVSADALYCWFCGNNVEEIVADESEALLKYDPYGGEKEWGCLMPLILICLWAVYIFLGQKFLGGSDLSDPQIAIALGGLSILGFISALVLDYMNLEGYSKLFLIWGFITAIGTIIFLIKWIF